MPAVFLSVLSVLANPCCLYSVFLLNNGSLFISQVKQRNTGRYRCVAQGLRGLPVSLEAFLRIAGKPHTSLVTLCEIYHHPVTPLSNHQLIMVSSGEVRGIGFR